MVNRRQWIASAVAGAAAAQGQSPSRTGLTQGLDRSVARLIDAQVLNADSRFRGGLPDGTGLFMPGSAGGLIEQLTTAFVWPESKYHGNSLLIERVRLASQFIARSMTKDGNINLLSTNFNSPPDTAFLMHNLCTAAIIARKQGANEIEAALAPILLRAAGGLVKGGIHTPNHRWVICSALAQLQELYPDPRYLKRIEQWLAEGIDIDSDGQFSERSTTVYSAICDRAFTVMAAKLNRPALLEPVRRNLNSLLYLLHPDGEVVTEISRRQDRNQRATADRYWFPIRYLAVHDNNGQFESMGRDYAAGGASVSALIEYPELLREVEPKPIPDNYQRNFPALGITRIRRGSTSATLILGDSDRFFSFRHGGIVVNAVRFASAFFGKGQFEPHLAEERDGGWYFEQQLEGPYWQPLEHPGSALVTHEEFTASKKLRQQSEVAHLRQSAWVKETAKGFTLRVAASGTGEVPMAIEISFSDGGKLDGCVAHQDAWILEKGFGTLRVGDSGVRFGPGLGQHKYLQLRGALAKLEGRSVYLTALTPIDHTIEFEWLASGKAIDRIR